MPYKFEYEKMKMKREDKKSVKLTLEDREEIKKLYATGEYSQRELARKFKVSRTLITLYTNDEKFKRHRELYRKRQQDGRYYDREKQQEYSRICRRNKKKLYEENKLEKGDTETCL